MKSNRKPFLKNRDALLPHYRLLGLKRGESRVNVIRSAASAMATALKCCDQNDPEFLSDVSRAEIAIAAYRLLDPRERNDVYERIQLVFPMDREDIEPPTIAAGTLADRMPHVTQRVGARPVSTIKLMKQPVIDEAIDGSSTRCITPALSQVERVSTLSIQIDSEPSLDERRNVVRVLMESEEESSQRLSPIGWIRSRLGI